MSNISRLAALAAGLLSWSTTACVSWGRTPAFPEGAPAPAPVVAARASACPGAPSSSFVVVDATHAAPVAGAALDQELARWRVPTLQEEADSCELVGASWLRADWADVHAPAALLEQARRSGARSLLVPVVTSEYTCLVDVVGSAGMQIRTGTSRCYESEVFLLAYLFSTAGPLLWRKQVRVTHGSYTLSAPARYEPQAEELLSDLPIATATEVRR